MRRTAAGVLAALLWAPTSGAQEAARLQQNRWKLYDAGADVIGYEKYGKFQNLGTDRYAYVIEDMDALAREAGEGVFPNAKGVLDNPFFKKYKDAGLLTGNPWENVHVDDLRRSYFMWATAKDDPGVRQFFTAYALERAGHLRQAVKGYHACLVHFPASHGYTFWNSVWYIGPTALDRLNYILRRHPELGLKLEGAEFFIENGFNGDLKDDRFVCNPGQLRPVTPQVAAAAYAAKGLSGRKITKVLVNGPVVKLVRYDNGHWSLLVNGKPFIMKGMVYQPNPVGLSPDNESLNPTADWQTADIDKNGLVDGPFDAWVDANGDGKRNPTEEQVGDFALMRDMGVNTVRIYHHVFNRKLIDTLYHTYGIRVILGDLLGAYTVGSGASWSAGTDYADPEQRKKMLDGVRKMVMEYKDHPGVLMWVLGNENVYGTNTNAPKKPEAFYSLCNDAARMIKSIDKTRPVAISNGDLLFADVFAKHAPDVDVFGCNAYRGNHGFGQSLWESGRRLFDKPIFISEYGCPAYHQDKSQSEAETLQAEFLSDNWKDIAYNAAGSGSGNSLGGFLFEWVDEWWKAGTPPQFDPGAHDVTGQWRGPFPDGWMYEEWLGVASQGAGKSSPTLRHLRKSYFALQSLWRPSRKR